MYLDGSYVEEGDAVYSVVYGPGLVYEVKETHYIVLFTGKGKRTFSWNGVESGLRNKTLFWHDPIIVTPPKSIDRWNTLKNIGRFVTEQLEKAKF